LIRFKPFTFLRSESNQRSATPVTFLWLIRFIVFLWFESDKPNRPNKRDRPNELWTDRWPL